jgi:nucleoside-diphosphate-sugar epimerase
MFAAVHDCHQKQVPKRADGKWSEEDLNETSTLEGSPPEGYWLSKVLAEKAAWALAKQHELDLVKTGMHTRRN